MCLSHTNTTFVHWKWFQVWGQDIINPTLYHYSRRFLHRHDIVTCLLVCHYVERYKNWTCLYTNGGKKLRLYLRYYDFAVREIQLFFITTNDCSTCTLHYSGKYQNDSACNTCLQFDTTVCMHFDRKCWFWHTTIKCTYCKAPETGDFASL